MFAVIQNVQELKESNIELEASELRHAYLYITSLANKIRVNKNVWKNELENEKGAVSFKQIK